MRVFFSIIILCLLCKLSHALQTRAQWRSQARHPFADLLARFARTWSVLCDARERLDAALARLAALSDTELVRPPVAPPGADPSHLVHPLWRRETRTVNVEVWLQQFPPPTSHLCVSSFTVWYIGFYRESSRRDHMRPSGSLGACGLRSICAAHHHSIILYTFQFQHTEKV